MGFLYLKKDQNGGVNVSIPLVLIMAIVTIIGLLAPVVMAYGKLTERVDNLEIIGPLNTETIKNIESRLVEMEKVAVGTDVLIQEIQKDIGEIKIDLKYIIKEIGK